MFSANQIDELAKPLNRANVKTRPQAGRQLSYIEGWHAINEANRIFGFDAWDREMIDLRLVSEAPCLIGKEQRAGHRVSYIARVRVTVYAGGGTKILRDGTGYGDGIDVNVGAAHESAVKEAETDAMKRALMTFGNPFGLALYDKEQSEVENAPRPQNASANGATRQASTAGSRAQTARAPQNSPAGAGPTATKAASPSERPFPGDQPSRDEHARPMSEAGREFLAAIRQRISSAKLPSKIDDLIKANGGGLSRLHEESAQAYEDLMMFANSAKQEMLAGTG